MTASQQVYKIPLDKRPRNREDGSQRLYYLCAEVSLLCAQTLSNCLAACRSERFGEAIRDRALQPVEHQIFTGAIKHTACMVLYLMAYEQGEAGDMPVWLSDFLASCVGALDRIMEGRTARDIMKEYASTEGAEVYKVAPVLIFRELGFGDLADRAARPLEEYFESSQKSRSEMLRYTLETPRENLSRRISELVPPDDFAIEGT